MASVIFSFHFVKQLIMIRTPFVGKGSNITKIPPTESNHLVPGNDSLLFNSMNQNQIFKQKTKLRILNRKMTFF